MVETTRSGPPDTPRYRDWTQGPILRNLLFLAWPMIVMEAFFTISQILDMVWVGRSGSSSIAALGIGSLVIALVFSVDIGLISGMRAMVSRFMGASDPAGARQVAVQVYLLVLCWGIPMSIAGYFLAGPIMNIFNVEPAVASEGARFLQVMFGGWLSMEGLVIGLYIIQSTGDSIHPMLIEIAIRAVHMALCPLLVLGIGFFPEMGITGAAWSNVAGQVLGVIAGLWFLFSGRTRLKLGLKDIRIAPDVMWRIIKIGLPSFFSMLLSNISMLVLTWIIIPFGTVAVAANSLVANIHGFINAPNMGLGGGVSVLVGQNLGARQPERAARSAWLGAAILEILLVSFAVAVLVLANRILGGFTSDSAVIETGAGFLRIMAAVYLVLGFNTALMSCLGGAGDTLTNMIINIGMIWVLQIPLSYILANYTALDVYGIRWALVISTFTGSIAYYIYFRLGKWKHKRV
jgi:putative MATE family efflux protein